jgi:hypothetical protein
MKRLLTIIAATALAAPVTANAGKSIFETDDATPTTQPTPAPQPPAPATPASPQEIQPPAPPPQAPAPKPIASKETIVYVLSGGGSMIDKIAQAKIDLQHQIEQLAPDQSFDVVFAQNGRGQPFFPTPVQPSDENKHKAIRSLGDCVTAGISCIYDGLRAAVLMHPTKIVLLSNAEFRADPPYALEDTQELVLRKIRNINSRVHAVIITSQDYVKDGVKGAKDERSTVDSRRLLDEISEQNAEPKVASAQTATPPATAYTETTPSFVGYSFHKPGRNNPWTLTLAPNGVVKTDFRIAPDHWESTGTHVLIFWSDGVIDMLEPQPDGTFTAKGYDVNNGGRGWVGTLNLSLPNQ